MSPRGYGKQQSGEGSIFRSCPEDVRAEGVSQLLEGLGMGKFLKALLDRGMDSLDILLEATEEDLKALDIPLGFRIKFNKKRLEMRSARVYEPMAKDNEKFAEERNPRSVRSDTVQMSSGVDRSQFATQCEDRRRCCYQCFKPASEQHCSEYAPGKSFCSARCLKLFFIEKSVMCGNQDCRAICVKHQAIFHEGRWYCQQPCCSHIEERTEPEDGLEGNEPLKGIPTIEIAEVADEAHRHQASELEEDVADLDFSF